MAFCLAVSLHDCLSAQHLSSPTLSLWNPHLSGSHSSKVQELRSHHHSINIASLVLSLSAIRFFLIYSHCLESITAFICISMPFCSLKYLLICLMYNQILPRFCAQALKTKTCLHHHKAASEQWGAFSRPPQSGIQWSLQVAHLISLRNSLRYLEY